MQIPKLINQFETLTLEKCDFTHEVHILIAFHYMKEHDFLTGLSKLKNGFKKLTKHFDLESKYNETITIWFGISIYSKLQKNPEITWHEFKLANEILIQDYKVYLSNFYYLNKVFGPPYSKKFILPESLNT